MLQWYLGEDHHNVVVYLKMFIQCKLQNSVVLIIIQTQTKRFQDNTQVLIHPQ